MKAYVARSPVAVKVALAPAFAIACMIGVGALGLAASGRLSASLAELSDLRMPKVVAANQLQGRLQTLREHLNQSLAWEGAGFPEPAIRKLDAGILHDLDAYRAELVAAAGQGGLDEGLRRRMAKALAQYDRFRANARDTLDIKSGNLANAASFMAMLDDSYANMKATLDAIVVDQMRQATEAAAGAKAIASANGRAIVAGCVLALAAAVALTVAMWRLLVRPVEEALALSGTLSTGDLRVDGAVPVRDDELGRLVAALRQIARGLAGVVVEIRAAAEEVSSAAGEIATGNLDLSGRTEQAASALELTASSVEELSGALRDSAESLRQADVLAQDAAEVAREGGAAVGEAVRTMADIDGQAQRIGEIVGVIDSIAFQTNVLALNAAVEAARAGQHGRGFAVVAGEVRSLAQRCAAAAREIGELVGSSVRRIGEGSAQVRSAGATMDRIVLAADGVSSTLKEIAGAVSAQAEGMAVVSRSVVDMDRTTQQNAALVEEASAATESLKLQERRLVALLEKLRTE